MVEILEVKTRKDNRAKVQAGFGRRVLSAMDCQDAGKLDQLTPILRRQVVESDAWVRQQHGICRSALDADTFCLSVATPEHPGQIESLVRELRHLADLFQALEPRAKSQSATKLVLVLFAGVESGLLSKAVSEADFPSQLVRVQAVESSPVASAIFQAGV